MPVQLAEFHQENGLGWRFAIDGTRVPILWFRAGYSNMMCNQRIFDPSDLAAADFVSSFLSSVGHADTLVFGFDDGTFGEWHVAEYLSVSHSLKTVTSVGFLPAIRSISVTALTW